MDLTHAIGPLAAHFGLDPLRPDAQGAIGLRFGQVTVGFRPDAQGAGLVMQSCLGSVAPRDEALLQALLAANLVPPSVLCGSLGLDAEGNAFLTLRLSGQDMDFPLLLRALGQFIGRARQWQAQLEGQTAAVPSVPFALEAHA